MKYFKLIICSIAIAVVLQGCKKEEAPTNSSDSTIQMNIEHRFGTQKLDLSGDYTLPSKETVRFSRYAYLLSNFYLIHENGSREELNDQYAFIDVERGLTSFTLNHVPEGNYTGMGFMIGLDSAVNHGNPNIYETHHPLSPINNSLHWGWTGGYVFTAIEGIMQSNKEGFVYHLAGLQNQIDVELPVEFTKGNARLNANIQYQIDEVFQTPEVFSLANDGTSTHNVSDPISQKLIQNMQDVISVVTISEP